MTMATPRTMPSEKRIYVLTFIQLRKLDTVSSTYILMGRCNHSLLFYATIMVSKTCPVIGEQVIISMAQYVTIATVWPA